MGKYPHLDEVPGSLRVAQTADCRLSGSQADAEFFPGRPFTNLEKIRQDADFSRIAFVKKAGSTAYPTRTGDTRYVNFVLLKNYDGRAIPCR
ncbi:hypothetical protein E9536_40515 [Burkholderia sp. LS-044]|uniref:hypothetical protein n=1 Tax=Burkholderia sp. LS-044 TaxID=1459967 RepID=UPI0010A5CC88|nr:hypothetical protein [Burkholderia sp. LS-044]THJ45978.1 hypothetical protein E9536_40515 [Burkholderia sp. LS-044]